jgi:hypothetical protein
MPCAACPPGFACYGGGCVPAYPVCAPGYLFDGRYCVPSPYAAPPAPVGPDPEEERILQLRIQNRPRPKITIDLQGGLGMLAMNDWDGDVSVPAPSSMVLVGYRQNYTASFGLVLRGGAMLGAAILSYSPTSDSSDDASDGTLMIGGMAEACPFFGPFGRFYIGPSLWAGYVSFGQEDLRAQSQYYGTASFHLTDGPMYGIGASSGFLLGDSEQTDLNMTARLDLNPDHKATLFLMFGVGFVR